MQPLKTQKKCSKMQFLSIFPDIMKPSNSGERILMPADLKGCVTCAIYILYLFQVP